MSGARAADLHRARLIEAGDAIPSCTSDIVEQIGDRASECALLFTSGSTGKPKGCMLSNDYFLTMADWYRGQGGVATVQPGDIKLTRCRCST